MSVGTYLAASLAAWGGMGLFCLRADSVRSRYGWGRYAAPEKRRQAVFASALCLLSLGLTLTATQVAFAVILCLVQLGLIGIAITLLLPYCSRWLPISFRCAGAGAALAAILLPLLN